MGFYGQHHLSGFIVFLFFVKFTACCEHVDLTRVEAGYVKISHNALLPHKKLGEKAEKEAATSRGGSRFPERVFCLLQLAVPNR